MARSNNFFSRLAHHFEAVIHPAAPLVRNLRRQIRDSNNRLEAKILELDYRLERLSDSSLAALDARLREIERRLPCHPFTGPGGSLLQGYAEVESALSSARYMTRNMIGARHFPSQSELLIYCVEAAGFPSTILEFGVFSGTTIRVLAEASPPGTQLYGFDSFEGLPEDWRPGFEQGTFRTNDLPEVPDNVTLINGWFDETLPGFAAELAEPVRLVHVDCDLYSSTRTILETLRDHFADDCVVIFDEYFNYPGWENHEFKAFREFVQDGEFCYEYIGCVPSHQQVGVRLTRTRRREKAAAAEHS